MLELKVVLRRNIIAIVIFVIGTLILCYPATQGKTISQHDIRQHGGMASEIKEYRENHDRQILWTNSMFGGMPAIMISVKHTSNLYRSVLELASVIFPGNTYIFFFLMLGFYILMRSMKLDWRISIIGALAYALSTFYVMYYAAGHNSKVHALAYLPGILAGIIWLFKHKNILLGGVLVTVFATLEIGAGHPQMLYYFMFVIFFYCVYMLINYVKEKRLAEFGKYFGIMMVGFVLATIANYSYLHTTYKFADKSIRGTAEIASEDGTKKEGLEFDYVTHWSYGISETMTLFVPNFKGGSSSEPIGDDEKILKDVNNNLRPSIASQGRYWGDQPGVSGPAYAGALICFLFVLGLLIIKDRVKYAFLAGLVLTVMLSWGKNFPGLTNFFLEYFPLYNKFRAVSSLMVIAQLILPVLAMYCLHKLANVEDWKEKVKLSFINKEVELQKIVRNTFVVFVVFAGLMFVAPTMLNSFMGEGESQRLTGQLSQAGLNAPQITMYEEGLISAREAIFKADVMRTILFLLAGGVLFWLFAKKRVNQNVFIIGIGLLILLDLFVVDRRYLNDDNYEKTSKIANNYGIAPQRADQLIMADTDPHFRVMNLTVNTFNDATTSYFHKSTGGYHPSKLKVYMDLIERQIASDLTKLQASFSKTRDFNEMFANTNSLNMLNTKYLVVSPDQPLRNPRALGNAWFVNSINWVPNAATEVESIDDIDVANTVLIRDDYKESLQGLQPYKDSSSSIKLVSYDPEEMIYESSNSKEGFVVFSEVYYPENWKIYVDDQEGEIVRANFALRGAKIPAGNHKIRMVYEDTAFNTASTISFAGSGVSVLMVIVFLFLYYKPKSKGNLDSSEKA